MKIVKECRRSDLSQSEPPCPHSDFSVVMFTQSGKRQRPHNVRVQMARFVQKAIRTGKAQYYIELWQDYEEELMLRVQLEQMVKTEMKSQRERQRVQIGWDGFSLAYFQWFFSSEGAKQLLKLLLLDIYRDSWTPAQLCRLFKTKCCKSSSHVPNCTQTWREFLGFLYHSFAAEVENATIRTVTQPKEEVTISTMLESDVEECDLDGFDMLVS